MKIFYLAFALLLAGCAQPPAPTAKPEIDVAKEEAAIRATDTQWLAAAKARDAAKTASFWADDATLTFPGLQPVTGHKALLEFVTNAFNDRDFSISWTTDKVEVASSGDLAYETGTNISTMRAGRKIVTQKNNGVVVWKKQPDGQWKAVIDISSPAPPAK